MKTILPKKMKFCILCSVLLLFSKSTMAQASLRDILLSQLSTKHSATQATFGHTLLSAHFDDHFCTKEMMTKQLNFSIAKEGNCFLLSAEHFGYSHYGELKVGAGYGRRFGNRFSLALIGYYILNHAEGYSNIHSFTIGISSHCQITQKADIALSIDNPIHMRYGIVGEEPIPMRFALTFSLQTGERLITNIYGEKRLPGALDLGIETFYRPLPSLTLSGVCSLTKIGIGMHIPCKKIMFTIQCDWHYKTGITPQGTLYYFSAK